MVSDEFALKERTRVLTASMKVVMFGSGDVSGPSRVLNKVSSNAPIKASFRPGIPGVTARHHRPVGGW